LTTGRITTAHERFSGIEGTLAPPGVYDELVLSSAHPSPQS